MFESKLSNMRAIMRAAIIIHAVVGLERECSLCSGRGVALAGVRNEATVFVALERPLPCTGAAGDDNGRQQASERKDNGMASVRAKAPELHKIIEESRPRPVAVLDTGHESGHETI